MDKMNNYLAELKKLRTQCVNKNEETLLFYLDCLMKLHHAYIKIENTEMLSYIRQIVFPSFPLVEEYFINRVNTYFDPAATENKLKILEDVEISILTFCEVCETIIQSTNTADRMLIQSAPIDLALTLSPVKICAYCSSLLNNMAELYQLDDNKPSGSTQYAFSVSPSLVSLPEEILLFDTRPERGKVGVIRIPGKDLADIRHLRMQICHEFYHVLPGSEIRKRKHRAVLMGQIIMYDLLPRLTRGMKLSAEQKERLSEFLYKGIKTEIESNLLKPDASDRKYYSTEILNNYVDLFVKQECNLLNLAPNDLLKVLFRQDEENSFVEYQKQKDFSSACLKDLQNNIIAMFRQDNMTKKIIIGHSSLMREVFADLMCVLSLRIKPEEYCSSFRHNSKANDEELHFDLYLRAALVYRTMSIKEPNGRKLDIYLKKWKDWYSVDWDSAGIDDNKMDLQGYPSITDNEGFYNLTSMKQFMINVKKVIGKYEEKGSPEKGSLYQNTQSGDSAWCSGEGRLLMFSSPYIVKKYMDYCNLCMEEYLAFEEKHSLEFQKFRDEFFIEEESNMQLLSKISKCI